MNKAAAWQKLAGSTGNKGSSCRLTRGQATINALSGKHSFQSMRGQYGPVKSPNPSIILVHGIEGLCLVVEKGSKHNGHNLNVCTDVVRYLHNKPLEPKESKVNLENKFERLVTNGALVVSSGFGAMAAVCPPDDGHFV